MAQVLNPFSGRQFLDSNGDPYAAALLFIYTAGSSTKATTTQDLAGTTNHANPIVLNGRGEPADGSGVSQAIWQTSGVDVKLVLAPSTDTDPPVSAISTWDNISGINDTVSTIDEWIAGPAPTFIDTTSFSLVGDQTTEFHVGRRLKMSVTAGTIYATITVSAYTTLTTVTLVVDAIGTVDSGLGAVWYGIISSDNSSMHPWRKGDDVASAAALAIDIEGDEFDVTGTTTITSLKSKGVGTVVILQFDGILTFTHDATNLILPAATDIVTGAGDVISLYEYALGSWRLISYYGSSQNPSFGVHRNATDQANITGTDKIEWTTEEFDSHSAFSLSITLDNAAAVDKGGGLVGIPSTAHGLSANENITISSTTNYNGNENIVSVTPNEFVITASYVAETFSGTETCTVGTFKPLIAGKYLLSVSLAFSSFTDNDDLVIQLYKNGATYKDSYKSAFATSLSGTNIGDQLTLTVIVNANGSTDFFEIFARNVNSNTSDVWGDADITYWTGSRIS